MVNYETYEHKKKEYLAQIQSVIGKKSMNWVNPCYDRLLCHKFSENRHAFFKLVYQEAIVLMNACDKSKIDRSRLSVATMNACDYAKWLKSDDCTYACAIGVMDWLMRRMQVDDRLLEYCSGCWFNVNPANIHMQIHEDGKMSVVLDAQTQEHVMRNLCIEQAYVAESQKRADRKKEAVRQKELQPVRKGIKQEIESALNRMLDVCEYKRHAEEKLKADQLVVTLGAKEKLWVDSANELVQEAYNNKEELCSFHSQFLSPVIAQYAAA